MKPMKKCVFVSPNCFWLPRYLQARQWRIVTELCPISPLHNSGHFTRVLAFGVLHRTFRNSFFLIN